MPSSEDALARSNKLLRKQHEALVKALHAITEETGVAEEISRTRWDSGNRFDHEERAMGNTQCDHINDDNKSYECNTYYKKIVKCDICQDDNAGAVDNSEINDAIRKREKKACEDISIMDGDSTCGGLAAILGDLCNFDYGAPGAPCACMCGTMAEKDVAAMPREHTHGGSGRYGRPRAARETAVGPRRYYQDGDRLKETAVGPRRHHRDGQEKAVGAEPCDEYCESWEKFKESKADDNSQEEICGMYKSTRCSTCADVQAYCGWKKVTEDEVYTYSVTPGGKCMTLDGADPKYLYEGGKGSECEQLCDGMIDCFGYSISGYDNCLLWLQRDIMGGGDEWGDADCHIKDVSCSGNVGDDYNCGECYNGFSRKYLWGSACQAKNWGADTYTKGVCGEEYKCFTNNEDIGECPYGEYCPSV